MGGGDRCPDVASAGHPGSVKRSREVSVQSLSPVAIVFQPQSPVPNLQSVVPPQRTAGMLPVRFP